MADVTASSRHAASLSCTSRFVMEFSPSRTDRGSSVSDVEDEKATKRLSKLRAKIRVHEDAIISLRTEIYKMSTISCLPVEALCRTFSFVALQSLFWIPLTHVCWYWRRVALDDSTLWSHINTQRTALVGEFLDRSGETPLHVLISDPITKPFDDERLRRFEDMDEAQLDMFRREDFQRANLQCIDQIHRIRSLELNLTPGRTSAELLSVLTQPAPILEHLRFRDPGDVIERLFNDVMPRLRSLDLDGNGLPWNAPMFRGLTRLALKDFCFPRPLEMHQLLDILRSCPGLVSLSLDRVWLNKIVSSDLMLKTVKLPSLSRLNVRGVFDFVQSIFKHLIIPPGIDITLDWGHCPSNTETHPMFTYMADSQAPAELFLSKFQKKVFGPFLDVRHSSHIPVERNVMFKREVPRVLFTLMPEHLWHIIIVLDVRSASSGTQGTLAVFTEWRDLLDALPNLRTLKFTRDTQRECDVVEEETLIRALDAEDISPRSHYLCPSLSNLALSGVAFTENGPTSWGTAVDCLRRRHQHSQVAELCQLHIAKCINLTEPVIDDLRSCAVDLLWDGSGIQEHVGEVKED